MEGIQPTSDKQYTYDLSKDAAENLYLNGIDPVEFVKQFNAFQAEIIAEQLATAEQRAGKRRKMLGGGRTLDLLNGKLTTLKNSKDPNEIARIAGEAHQIYADMGEEDADYVTSVSVNDEISRLETAALTVTELSPVQYIGVLKVYFDQTVATISKYDNDSDIVIIDRTFDGLRNLKDQIIKLHNGAKTQISLDVEQQFSNTDNIYNDLRKKIVTRTNEISTNKRIKYGILLAGCAVLLAGGIMYLGGAGLIAAAHYTSNSAQFATQVENIAVTACAPVKTFLTGNLLPNTSSACMAAKDVLMNVVKNANNDLMSQGVEVAKKSIQAVSFAAALNIRDREGIIQGAAKSLGLLSDVAINTVAERTRQSAELARKQQQFALINAKNREAGGQAGLRAFASGLGAAASAGAAAASGGPVAAAAAAVGAGVLAGQASATAEQQRYAAMQAEALQVLGGPPAAKQPPSAAKEVSEAFSAMTGVLAAAAASSNRQAAAACGQQETGNAFAGKVDMDLQIAELRAVITGKLTAATDPEKVSLQGNIRTLERVAEISKNLGENPDPSKPETANKLALINKYIGVLREKHPIATAMPQAQAAPPPGAQIGVTAPTVGGGVLSTEDLILGNYMIICGISPDAVLAFMQSRLGASGGYHVPARAHTYRRKTRSGR